MGSFLVELFVRWQDVLRSNPGCGIENTPGIAGASETCGYGLEKSKEYNPVAAMSRGSPTFPHLMDLNFGMCYA